MSTLYIIGIGPGATDMMTERAREALSKSDIILGYKTYLDLIRNEYPDKEFHESGMREEISRCREAVELANEGKTVSLICSGDAGVYGMASPALTIAAEEGFSDIEVIAGVSAANAASGTMARDAPDAAFPFPEISAIRDIAVSASPAPNTDCSAQ